jgi:hypothetical protein
VAPLRRRLLGLAAAGLALAATAPPALGGGPANVTVRVEGDADTLVPRTALTTTTTPVIKDGVNACSGTSAAGALEQATAGDWTGVWDSGFATYRLDAVKGETHLFGSGEFWSIFVNGAPASSGLCGLDLQARDELLFAPEPEAGDQRNPLALQGVPSTVGPGQAVSVKVVGYVTTFGPPPDFAASTQAVPVAGATVSGGGTSATTGADGSAQLTLSPRGPAGLRATHSGDIRSATESVCVTDGSDGACGTTTPVTTPAAPCLTSGDDGNCGTTDRRAPRGRIASIRNGRHFAKGKGPRVLSGSVTADPSGIADVRLRLTLNDHGRCATYDGRSERLVTLRRCGATRGKWFSAGDREQWSYLLPAKLGRGRYVLDVQARDRAGNVDTLLQRTRSRVVFFVS